MPNYADNRLTLTGPADEIARFVRECVRVRPDDDPCDGPSLDLAALVPMPPEILATCDGEATDELRALAYAATGCKDWYDWSVERWGTKWNVTQFRGRLIGDTIFDCSFLTAWSNPSPALRALAARYPLLRGTALASDVDMDWFVTAVFQDGAYIEAPGPFDPQLQLLISSGSHTDPIAALSAEVLLSISTDKGLVVAPNAADRVWMRTALAIAQFGQRVGNGLPQRLAFERAVIGVYEQLRLGSKDIILASDMVHAPEYRDHVEFLLGSDRMRTQIDRELLQVLAVCLRDDAMWGGNDDAHREEIEYEILSSCTADALQDWACVAMCRPSILLDWRSEEALREGFLAYADQLRRDILDHLRGSADGGEHRLPAVA